MFVRAGLALAGLLSTTAAFAGDKPLYQAAPAWILAAPPIDFAGLGDTDPILVVLDQQQRISADGQVWEYQDRALRVTSPQMLSQVGQMQLSWQPDAGDLIVHSLEIIRGGERIDLLATGQRFEVLQRETQLEELQVTGTLTATMSVEGLRVGDVVRLRASTTNRDKAMAGNAGSGLELLADPARAKFARVQMSWPQGMAYKWRTYLDSAKPVVTQQGGYTRVDVPVPLGKQPELPTDAPARYRPLPVLEGTSFADWEAVSRTMAPHYKTEGTIAAGSPVAAEVAKIAAKSTDPRVRAALALRLVQDEVRYLFRGMNGGNYIPQSPADTWSRRYGDCKAKTMLLLAILRELGIDAEAVLVHSSQGDHVAKRLPSAGAFDHVVVRAQVAGQELWLDGTGNGTRIDDLGDTPAFGSVLPLRPAGAALVAITMRAPARPSAEIDIEYDQSAGLSFPTPFTIKTILRGAAAEQIHAAASQATKEQKDALAQQMVRSIIGDSVTTDRSVRYDPEAAMATVTVSGIVSSPWKKTEGRYRLELDRTVSQLEFDPDRARPLWKDIPVVSAFAAAPASAIFRVRVRLPGEGAGFSLEGNETIADKLAGVQIERKAVLSKGLASVDDRLESTGAEIAPADVAATRAQLSLAKSRLLEVVAPESYPARWRAVQALRRSNGFTKILAQYAKAIEEDPDAALGFSNRANFYAGVWDWKPAIADLDKAIAIEPTEGLYLKRATMRSMLMQDAAALSDAEAALVISPGSVAAITRVARLRFRAGRKDEALAMLDARIAAGGKEKSDYISMRATLLGEAGRVDEAVAAMDALIKTNPGNASLLNNRCWLKGTLNVQLDSALKDCSRAIEMAEMPASIYDSRALIYFRMGRLEEALADLDAALEVAPDQGASLFLRGVIRKQMADKRGDEDIAAARMMWAPVDAEYARYGIKP